MSETETILLAVWLIHLPFAAIGSYQVGMWLADYAAKRAKWATAVTAVRGLSVLSQQRLSNKSAG